LSVASMLGSACRYAEVEQEKLSTKIEQEKLSKKSSYLYNGFEILLKNCYCLPLPL